MNKNAILSVQWLFVFVVMQFFMGSLVYADAPLYSLGYEHENFGPAKSHTLKITGDYPSNGFGWLLQIQQVGLRFEPLVSATGGAGGVSSLDEKQNFMLIGMSYGFPDKKWFAGLNYGLGRGVQDDVSYHGLMGLLQYKGGDDWGVSVNLMSSEFKQEFDSSSRVAKASRPSEGSASLRQNAIGFGANWQMEDWLSFSLSGVRYSYSKDIRSFAENLEIYHGTSNLLSGLQNPLSAFNDKVFKFTTNATIEEWLVTYELGRFVSAVEDVATLSHSIGFKRALADEWRVFAGAGLSVTEKQVAVGSKSVNFYFAGVVKGF